MRGHRAALFFGHQFVGVHAKGHRPRTTDTQRALDRRARRAAAKDARFVLQARAGTFHYHPDHNFDLIVRQQPNTTLRGTGVFGTLELTHKRFPARFFSFSSCGEGQLTGPSNPPSASEPPALPSMETAFNPAGSLSTMLTVFAFAFTIPSPKFVALTTICPSGRPKAFSVTIASPAKPTKPLSAVLIGLSGRPASAPVNVITYGLLPV